MARTRGGHSAPAHGRPRTRPGAGLQAALLRQDANYTTAAAGLEVDCARGLREQRVVLPLAHAIPRLEDRSALAHDDLAAGDRLAGEDLHAKTLGLGVAAVAAGAESLLM